MEKNPSGKTMFSNAVENYSIYQIPCNSINEIVLISINAVHLIAVDTI